MHIPGIHYSPSISTEISSFFSAKAFFQVPLSGLAINKHLINFLQKAKGSSPQGQLGFHGYGYRLGVESAKLSKIKRWSNGHVMCLEISKANFVQAK